MEKRLKDVIGMYIGCKLWVAASPYDEIILTGVSHRGEVLEATARIGDKWSSISGTWYGNTEHPQLKWFKPMLKRLESLDTQDIVSVEVSNPFTIGSKESRAYQLVQLAKLGYDLFALIDSGEAIEVNE